MLTFAVHGATGSQGAAVLRALQDAGHAVRALSRNVDLADVDALVEAYTEVDGVALTLPLVFDETALSQAKAVLAALQKADVERVVFNRSASVPDVPVGVPFVDARVLMSRELPNVVDTVALVAPAMTYMENLAAPWSVPKVAAGEVVYPLPEELAVPWVAASDVGAVIADLLTTSLPPRVQAVAGPEDLMGDQVAAAFGASVRWHSITPAEYREMLRPFLGEAAAAGVAGSYENPAPLPDQAIVRRGSTTMGEWAAKQNWR